MTAPIIATHGLTKSFGAHRGIEDLSLEVRAGEVFGFLGPNGAGKTTTIRMLLDLLRPTAGSASLFGLDSRRDSLAIRRRLGNLSGDFACDPRLTGRQLLRFCARARLRTPDDLGTSDALARRLKADLDRPIGQLSRGNRQKVGLIQALFHEPELLILDEPTSGLDPIMQEEFSRLLAEHRAGGGTAFLSSHDLDEVQRVCDRVAIVRDARLIAVEEVAELRGRALHRVRIRFSEAVAPEEFARLGGVTDLRAEGTTITFRTAGNLDEVVKKAARHTVADMELTEPSLEEIFLTYYAQVGA